MVAVATQMQQARAAGGPVLAATAAVWSHPRRSAADPQRRQPPPRRPLRCSASSSGFHQSLLMASERPAALPPLPGPLAVREADLDDELQAAAWLRALSFYRYPEERKFAAEVGSWVCGTLGTVTQCSGWTHAHAIGII